MKVREAVVEYLAAVTVIPETRLNYKRKLEVFVVWCEGHSLTLEEVGGRYARRIINEFKEHLIASHHSSRKDKHGKPYPISSHTVRGYIVCIKMFFNWCMMETEDFDEYLNSLAIGRVKLPKADEKIVETFTDEHIRRMLLACNQEYNEHLRLRNKAIVSLLLATGIRVSELSTLTMKHVDLSPDAPYIKVMGKGRKEREIELDKETRRMLGTYKRKYREKADGDDSLFTDRSLSHGISAVGVGQIFEKLERIAEIKGVRCSPHTCRHTFAAHYMRDGGDIYRLCRILGHKNVGITELYLKTLSSRDIQPRLRLVR